jgi:hypothetical protein
MTLRYKLRTRVLNPILTKLGFKPVIHGFDYLVAVKQFFEDCNREEEERRAKLTPEQRELEDWQKAEQEALDAESSWDAHGFSNDPTYAPPIQYLPEKRTMKSPIYIVQPEDCDRITAATIMQHCNKYLQDIGAIGSIERIEQSIDTAMLDAAQKTGYLLSVTDDGYVFRHPSLAESVSEKIPENMRTT